VFDFNEYSDHAPLHFSITGERSRDQTYIESDCITTVKWNDNKRDEFRRSLISKLPVLNEIIRNVDSSNCDSVNNCINNFVNTVNLVAVPIFRKKKCPKRKGWKNNAIAVKRADWFETCFTLILTWPLLPNYQTEWLQANNCNMKILSTRLQTVVTASKELELKSCRLGTLNDLKGNVNGLHRMPSVSDFTK
jgi:hypothetical protein